MKIKTPERLTDTGRHVVCNVTQVRYEYDKQSQSVMSPSKEIGRDCGDDSYNILVVISTKYSKALLYS